MAHSIVFEEFKGLGGVLSRQLAARGNTVTVLSRSEPPVAEPAEGAHTTQRTLPMQLRHRRRWTPQ